MSDLQVNSEYYAKITYVHKDAVVGFGDYDYGDYDYGEDVNHELEDLDEAELGLNSTQISVLKDVSVKRIKINITWNFCTVK